MLQQVRLEREWCAPAAGEDLADAFRASDDDMGPQFGCTDGHCSPGMADMCNTNPAIRSTFPVRPNFFSLPPLNQGDVLSEDPREHLRRETNNKKLRVQILL